MWGASVGFTKLLGHHLRSATFISCAPKRLARDKAFGRSFIRRAERNVWRETASAFGPKAQGHQNWGNSAQSAHPTWQGSSFGLQNRYNQPLVSPLKHPYKEPPQDMPQPVDTNGFLQSGSALPPRANFPHRVVTASPGRRGHLPSAKCLVPMGGR